MSVGARYLAEKAELEQRIRAGARWFYLLAGLGIVAGIIGQMELGLNVPFAFGITSIAEKVISLIASYIPIAAKSTTLLVTGLASVLFVFMGYFAERKSRFGFLLGTLCYVGDGIIQYALANYIAVGFHVFVAYFLVLGFRAATMLKHYERSKSALLVPDATVSVPQTDAFAKAEPGSNNTVGIRLVKREWDASSSPAK